MSDVKLLRILPGCSDHEHASWFIGPVGHHRDSDLIEESNWQVMLARYREIDPDERDHEIHRFGHWGVGWIEEVAYRPGSAVERAADAMRKALDGYPILDEMHHSMLEYEAVGEAWTSWQCDEVRRELITEFTSRANVDDPSDATADEIEEWIEGLSSDVLWDLMHDRGEITDGAMHFHKRDFERAADALIANEERNHG